MGGARNVRRRWEELEMDCLVNVFEKLELQDIILGVPFVCKSWYRASLKPHYWKSINLSNFNYGPCSSFAKRFNHEYRIHNFSLMGLMKFALNRGRTSVVELLLPSACSLDNLIYASNKCPSLKILGLPMLVVKHNNFIPILFKDEEIKQFAGLITKWKDLEYLHIQESQSYTKEILFEISRHCRNFVGLKKTGLMADEEALAIVNHLPRLKHLTVTSAFVSRENLKMILEGCKELEDLVMKDCCGFEVDEEILKMTCHIKNFECEKDFRLCANERNYIHIPSGSYFYPDGSDFSDAASSD